MPLKKQLWQQTVKMKIQNQAAHLKKMEKHHENMYRWVDEVKSGDTENHEARAAVYYWKNLFLGIAQAVKSAEDRETVELYLNKFKREREGLPPNNLLNYGYAILRAVVARSLVGSGLIPTLGIFHRNQYNAYCLADDVMEPYRPFVDEIVLSMITQSEDFAQLTLSIKKKD